MKSKWCLPQHIQISTLACSLPMSVWSALGTRWCSGPSRLAFAATSCTNVNMYDWWGYLTESMDVTYVCVLYIKCAVVSWLKERLYWISIFKLVKNHLISWNGQAVLFQVTPGTGLGCKLLGGWKPAFAPSLSLGPIIATYLFESKLWKFKIDATVCEGMIACIRLHTLADLYV